MRVDCYDPQGKPCVHRVRIMPNGRLNLFDHPEGHPSRVLRWHALAGEKPHGCYWLLAKLKTSGESYGSGDIHYCERLHVASRCQRDLRALLRGGACHVRPVPGTYHGAGWVVAGDVHTADAIAACGPPATLTYFFNQPIKTDAGFVKVRIRGLGTVLWDLKLAPVAALLSEDTGAHEPGPLALSRLTKRLLEGWRGILPRG